MGSGEKMNQYTWLDALKNKDYWYFRMMLDDFYLDHIQWRIRHYWFHEKCETCRNWHYCGKIKGHKIGFCDWEPYNPNETGGWEGSHGYCTLYNDPHIDTWEDWYTFDEDGSEMPFKLPSGKWITVRSRSGHWQYLYDGMPKWY
jgi:hypothetical protein